MRKQKAGVPATVKIGYRGPKAARGLHPSGYTDNLITKPNDLLHLDPKTDAARISSTVGERKRIEITVKASEMGIKLLNAGDHPKNTEKKVQEQSEAT
jgi:large subunit ribosomal protein L32e